MANQLLGYSGCRLELVEIGGREVVRKTSFSSEYNQRLQSQCQKQFDGCLPNFQQTKIFNSGLDVNELFYFDMEHLPGQTLAHFLKTINVAKIPWLVDFFAKLYVPERKIYPTQLIFEKIENLQSKLNEGQIHRLKSSLLKLEKHNWEIETSHFCHGDLSFENIIVCNGQLYLIDFLDSFADSWMMDFAKIMQDTEVGWAYRNEVMTMNVQIRLESFRTQYLHNLIGKGLSFKQLSNCYHLLLLNIYRIFPYIKNSLNEEFLYLSIEKILDKIKNLENEYEHLNCTLRR